MAKFICPYCVSEYNKKQVLHVCQECGITAKPRLFERRVKCDTPGCGGYANLRQCPSPECGETIPRAMLHTPNYLRIAVVGGAISGKNTYTTVVLEELRHDLNLITVMQDNPTHDWFVENRRSLYEDQLLLGAGFYRPPLNCEIRNLGRGSKDRGFSLTINIIPGEYASSFSSHAPRLVQKADAFIVVIDPLQFPAIRVDNSVPEDIIRNSLAGTELFYEYHHTINELAHFLREVNGIRPSALLTKPALAVVFSKFDTIINHPALANATAVKKPSYAHANGKLNMADIYTAHNEIAGFLEAVGEGQLLRTLNANFQTYKFFAVSSLGTPPEGPQNMPQIRSHRALDPVHWLFKTAVFID